MQLLRHIGLAAMAGAQAASAGAQAAPQLSPQAVYDEATRPIEIVHRSISNWSDVEVQALAVAIKNGAVACAARKPEQFTGDTLIAYTKLCSLGQNWSAVDAAATRYLESTDDAKPQLTLAYAFKIDAALHLRNQTEILTTTKAMLQAVPYDAVADASVNGVITYLQLAFPADARAVAGWRQPLLLAAIASDKPSLPKFILYEDGLAKARLEQYATMSELASETVLHLDAALAKGATSGLSDDDTIPIAESRRRYALLGQPLPALTLTLSLYDVRETPRINPDRGAATALLLFPDWCAQCVRMTVASAWKAVVRQSEDDIRFYALLAQSTPDKEALAAELKRTSLATSLPGATKKAVVPVDPDAAPPTPAMLLLRTPTLTVPTATLTQFAAADFPLLIVVDHANIVRFAGTAPEAALEPGNFLDQVVSHVADTWSASAPTGQALEPKGPAAVVK